MAEFYLKEDLVDAKPITTEPVIEKDISTNKILKELCDAIKGVTIIQKVSHTNQLGSKRHSVQWKALVLRGPRRIPKALRRPRRRADRLHCTAELLRQRLRQGKQEGGL
eukprot:TRINITY_DN7101_c0_g2_i2.p1 TRINITY_DN7101_c0_g2~~TRINITY_DN7101_c0_g2_i2.p1  ORF type:complete len:109 (+),score=8.92 TRINITY_DN7101_c0_g2_i2:453-779(+)